MKNKLPIILLVFTLFSWQLRAQSGGISVGYDGQFTKYNNTVKIIGPLTLGFQQTFLNRFCMGINFSIRTATSTFLFDEIEAVTSDDKHIYYQSEMKSYRSYGFESRFFFKEFDDAPIGAYIGSSYRLTHFISSNYIDHITDDPQNPFASRYQNYNQVEVGGTYESQISVHSFGLRLGVMAGPYLHLYTGVDYNIPVLTENEHVAASNLALTPQPGYTTLHLGASLGIGLGY